MADLIAGACPKTVEAVDLDGGVCCCCDRPAYDHRTETDLARPCEGEPLDGHAHDGPVVEYVRFCARNHERRGWLCQACARPQYVRGPGVVTCAECPDDDPLPGVLVEAAIWDNPGAAWEVAP